MSEVNALARAATVAFALLFSVPLALSAAFWAIAALLGQRPPRPGWPEVRDDARFAALWAFVGFVPAALLMRLGDAAGPASSWAFVGFGALAFLLAIRSSRLEADPAAQRFAWASLEAVLVAMGFLLFDGALALFRGLGKTLA